MLKVDSKQPEARSDVWNRLSFMALEGTSLVNIFILDLQTELGENKFLFQTT